MCVKGWDMTKSLIGNIDFLTVLKAFGLNCKISMFYFRDGMKLSFCHTGTARTHLPYRKKENRIRNKKK